MKRPRDPVVVCLQVIIICVAVIILCVIADIAIISSRP